MSEKDNNKTVNRRSVLSGISGAAVAGGLSSVAVGSAAAKDDAELKERALESPEVQSILDELDDPALGTVAYRTEETGESTLEFVNIETSVGMLVYAEAENGQTSALLSFEDGSDTAGLPGKYRRIPSGTDPTLFGRETDTVLRRSATDREIEALERVTDLSDEADVFTGSDINGFLVVEVADSGAVRERDVIIDEPFDGVTEELGADLEIEPADVTVSPSDTGMTTAGDCDDHVKECVMSGTACAACSGSCAGAPTGIGAIACAACIQGMCVGIAGTACAAAVGTCLG